MIKGELLEGGQYKTYSKEFGADIFDVKWIKSLGVIAILFKENRICLFDSNTLNFVNEIKSEI